MQSGYLNACWMFATTVGLLSEEYDPVAKRLLGNFPQAFSHVGLVNTAFNLSRIFRQPAVAPAGERANSGHSGHWSAQAVPRDFRLAAPAHAACAGAGREHALSWELQRDLTQSFAS